LQDKARALHAYLRAAMASGKSLWFLMIDARFLWGGLYDWMWPKVLAAFLGTVTVALTYVFARRFYDDSRVALLAAGLLAVMPGHVFYSRIGLQEALSTLLVLGGLYAYLVPHRFGWRSFAAGLLLSAAFFSNYRLIMLPVLLVAAEGWLVLSHRRYPELRHFVWTLLMFFAGIFIVGNFDDGANTRVIFSWIFHQGQEATEHFDWINLLSHPFYLFRLENAIFAVLFFSAVFLMWGKERLRWVPAVLVLTQMAVFSLTHEKAPRYLCVMFPFMAMTVAYVAVAFYRRMGQGLRGWGVLVLVAVMMITMGWKSWQVARIRTDYRDAVEFINADEPSVKFLSTQRYVHNLYTESPDQVADLPHDFNGLLALVSQGYDYMVLGPQAYISWTQDRKRFQPELEGYLQFITANMKPLRVFPHMSQTALERFVFEHSENLIRSQTFVRDARDKGYGSLRIYDARQATSIMLKLLRDRGISP
jgi:hypothetical protein